MSEFFPKFEAEISAAEADVLKEAIDSQDIAPEASVQADCVSVTITDGKACLNLPFDLGRKCVKVPDWVPNGEPARVCISVRRRYGIPVGVNVCVYVDDKEVACAYFGV
jgi:hypothetical protein